MSIQLARVNLAMRKPAGTPWPETFTPKQIAHFIAWRGDEPDPNWSARAAPLHHALHIACERGELASTTSAVRVPAPGLHVRNTGYPNFIRKPTPTVEATVRHIAAAPLAAWLEAQHVQPGELLLAWFEAQGVGVAVEPPAPAKKEPVPDRNARWLRAWDDESPRHEPGSQAAAIAKIVAAEGVERATVKKALQTAEKARDEARRDGNVSSMPKNKKAPASLFPTTVHRMK